MAFSTEQRADQVAQANAEKNRNKEEAKEILSTEAGVLQMASLAEEGGSMGRKIARELRQFEATGRVSNWLAGETIKAESKREVPSSVVDDFVRRGAAPSTFQVQPALPFGGLPQFVPTIPSEGIGGDTGLSCVGLALYVKSTTSGEPPTTTQQVWIGAGTVAGLLPSGFDPSEGKFIASTGSGRVWAQININENTGEINLVAVNGGGNIPNNTNTSFYYTLGYYEYNQDGNATVTNYGCGSLDVSICRNWFVAEPPYFSAIFSR
jgi:hypothetical protein